MAGFGIMAEDFDRYTTAQLALRITHLRGVIRQAEMTHDSTSASTIAAAVDRAQKIFMARPDCGGIMLAPPVGSRPYGLTIEAGAVCDYLGLDRKQVAGSLPGEVIEAVDVMEWSKAHNTATEAPQDAEDAPGEAIDDDVPTETAEEEALPDEPVAHVPSSPHDGARLESPLVTPAAQREMDKVGMTVEHMEAVMTLPKRITLETVRIALDEIASKGGAA